MKMISGDYTAAWVLTSTQALQMHTAREGNVGLDNPCGSSWLFVLDGQNYSWLLETCQADGAARFSGGLQAASNADLRPCWREHTSVGTARGKSCTSNARPQTKNPTLLTFEKLESFWSFLLLKIWTVGSFKSRMFVRETAFRNIFEKFNISLQKWPLTLNPQHIVTEELRRLID